jgi:hypothetical protein
MVTTIKVVDRNSQPRVLHRPRYKPWHKLRRDGELDEIILRPGQFLSDREIKDKWLHKYYPLPEEATEITRDTIFWYAPGEYKLYKPTHPLQAEMAGIYLKGVLPVSAQEEALKGFEQMNWEESPPHRPETKPAIERQAGLVKPGELLYGYTNRIQIELTRVSRQQATQFRHLRPLLSEMNTCFARTLPAYFGLLNRPKSPTERQEEGQKKKRPDYGGIPSDYRQFLTAFSTITLLRSCPAAIHKDGGNARQDQTSFTCLTSVGRRNENGDVAFSGGTFCLIEYGIKIPVRPGDILIAQTTREWHYNTTPVKGTKYSIVCYYRRGLANPKWKLGKSVLDRA